ncbi:hypothetical protein [Streptomyces sp. B8F3]|uniref:hypothetical protein n=1 Tax=unclassified Streptomyces TaxID=2593676 RepID=UPI00325D1538
MTDDARALVSTAQALLRPPAGTAEALGPGVRARAAAMLLRLALDRSLDDFWCGVAPDMTRNGKHRILCLEAYTDRGTARRWYLTWNALSTACHHRAHELPPSPGEIQGRLLEVDGLLDAIGGGTGSAATAAEAVPSPGPGRGRPVPPPGTPTALLPGARHGSSRVPRPGPPGAARP